MRIEDDALLLRRIPFRDASWIVSLLTRRHGMLSAMARDARRGPGEARAALTGFHSLLVEVRGRGEHAMGTLGHVEIVRVRHRLPFMPVAAAAAQVLGEAVYRFVLPGDVRQEATHGVLESALDALDAGREPLVVAGSGLGQLLWLFGYGWRVDLCIGCGGDTHLSYFSTRRGAAVCAACGAPYAGRLQGLNDAVRRTMARRDWPLGLERLSVHDLSIFYRMVVARLVLTGGRSLATDVPFRRLALVTPVAETSPMMKGMQNDRQSFA
ncbi:MAG: DNA repair protein RecO [Magnetococcales bacterium]|nr:DNA repair protein RecO [Magnetococcales bacterium]